MIFNSINSKNMTENKWPNISKAEKIYGRFQPQKTEKGRRWAKWIFIGARSL